MSNKKDKQAGEPSDSAIIFVIILVIGIISVAIWKFTRPIPFLECTNHTPRHRATYLDNAVELEKEKDCSDWELFHGDE